MKPSFPKLKIVLSAVLGLLFSTFSLIAQVDCQNQQSTAFFDINQCSAGGNYDEFTADVNNGIGCTALSIVGGNLFRDNAPSNPHSCTLGLNVLMRCVSVRISSVPTILTQTKLW